MLRLRITLLAVFIDYFRSVAGLSDDWRGLRSWYLLAEEVLQIWIDHLRRLRLKDFWLLLDLVIRVQFMILNRIFLWLHILVV